MRNSKTARKGPSKKSQAPTFKSPRGKAFSGDSRSFSSGRTPQAENPSSGRSSAFAGRSGGAPKEDSVPRSWRAIIGHHAIREALQCHPHMAKVLWIKTGFESSQDLRDIYETAQHHEIKTEVLADTRFDRFGTSHQGAALYLDGGPKFDIEGLRNFTEAKVVVLDGIEDPHNLGAILRTSWLLDVQGILIPQDRAVGLTPTVHKVACGGAEHVPVLETSNFANPIQELKDQGFWVFGLSHKAKKTVFDMTLPEKVVWVVGAEDKGLRVNTERLCDELVSIPQVSAGASYNASVAAAIALSETARQHAQRGNRKKPQ